MIPRAVTPASSPITGAVILIAILLLLVLFSVRRKQYALHLKGLINNRGRQMLYDNETPNLWADVILFIVALAGLSLLSLALVQYSVGVLTIKWYHLLLLPAIASWFLVKWSVMKLLGYTFNMTGKMSDFISAYFTSLNIAGVLSIFLSVGLMYATGATADFSFVCVIILTILVKIFVLFKLLQIFYNGIGSLFYIFLYLCTLEIMPLFVMLKLVLDDILIV